MIRAKETDLVKLVKTVSAGQKPVFLIANGVNWQPGKGEQFYDVIVFESLRIKGNLTLTHAKMKSAVNWNASAKIPWNIAEKRLTV